jgi:RecA/RadA recombinase
MLMSEDNVTTVDETLFPVSEDSVHQTIMDKPVDDTAMNDNNESEVEETISDDITEEDETSTKTTKKKKTKTNKVAGKAVPTTTDDIIADLNMFLKQHVDINTDEKETMVMSTGIDLLDAMCGGGIGMKFIQFVGNPGCAKSTLAAKLIAAGQRKYKNKFISLYHDSEHSQSTERLAELGVIAPKINPISEGITVEKILKSVHGLCQFKAERKDILNIPSLIIWDSIANTLTEKGFIADSPDRVLGEKARVLSSELPKVVESLNRFNVSLVGINQLRDKIELNMYSRAPNDLKYLGESKIPGGKSMLFNSFQLFFLKHSKDTEDFGFNGAFIDIKSIKNKLFTPNITIRLVMSFQRGFSNFWTNFEFLKSTKRIKASAWCTLINLEEIKFRQKDAINMYITDEKFKGAFDELVRDAIQKEIIEEYKPKFVYDEVF